MALFTSYAPPGVYTTEIFVPNTATSVGTSRIPVIIGEGQQTFTFSNVELFRGSSPVQDDQSVNENISDQVVGFTRNFQTTFYPVVDGTGKGVTTNDPSKVQVQAIYPNGDVVPVNVISLDGATGQFVTQEIIPAGTDLTISYFFKRGDTLVTNESLLGQVPAYAALAVTETQVSPPVVETVRPQPHRSRATSATSSASSSLTAAAARACPTRRPWSAAAATTSSSTSARRTTRSAAPWTCTTSWPARASRPLTAGTSRSAARARRGTLPLTPTAAVYFSGGSGPGSNTVFQVKNFPITDGTNGGVTTTNPANVTVLLNGTAVAVAAVDGTEGLITLASPVSSSAASLTVTYYYNTWQNTFDLLPSANVAAVQLVGLGPNRADFVQGIDYSLGVAYDSHGNVVADTINWGNNVSEAIGVDSTGDTPFSPSEVSTSLVDEKVYLRALSGSVNGKNTVFGLPDVPTDGSGLNRTTNDPTLISVHVGAGRVRGEPQRPGAGCQPTGGGADRHPVQRAPGRQQRLRDLLPQRADGQRLHPDGRHAGLLRLRHLPDHGRTRPHRAPRQAHRARA